MKTILVLLSIYSFSFFSLANDFPDVSQLLKYKTSAPLKIYSHDGELISKFGDPERYLIKYCQIPDLMVKATISAEDPLFFEHNGLDPLKLLIAAFTRTRENGYTEYRNPYQPMGEGATITMQLGLNLNNQYRRNWINRIKGQIIVAYAIEKKLSKKEILESYLNRSYFGYRSYGVVAAAEFYYGKKIQNLSLAQYAMIAGLPITPSYFDPIKHPKRAMVRRNYVLGQMRLWGHITQAQHDHAIKEPITAKRQISDPTREAHYVAEMARQYIFEKFGNDIYTKGFKVYTTIDLKQQSIATVTLRNALLKYARQQAYRGPIKRTGPLPKEITQNDIIKLLDNHRKVANLIPAIVVSVDYKQSKVAIQFKSDTSVNKITLSQDDVRWTQNINSQLQQGDIVYVYKNHQAQWALIQIPKIQGGMVSIKPDTGEITSLVGGFSFYRNKFNIAVNIRRKTGDLINVGIFSATIKKGLSPNGHSRNSNVTRLVGIIGKNKITKHLVSLGINKSQITYNKKTKIINFTASPLQLTALYSIYANKGQKITPFFIKRIEHPDKSDITNPPKSTPIKPGTAIKVSKILRQIVSRKVLRGKNLFTPGGFSGQVSSRSQRTDAWFTGYNSKIVTTVWFGYKDKKQLAAKANGLNLAYPVWQNFIKVITR